MVFLGIAVAMWLTLQEVERDGRGEEIYYNYVKPRHMSVKFNILYTKSATFYTEDSQLISILLLNTLTSAVSTPGSWYHPAL